MKYEINDRVAVAGLGVGSIVRIDADGGYHVALDSGGTWRAASAAELVPQPPDRTGLAPGVKVITASELSSSKGWVPKVAARRRPGERGVISRRETVLRGTEGQLWEVDHDGHKAVYYEHELTVVEETPEQPLVKELHERVCTALEQVVGLREAMASGLSGLEERMDSLERRHVETLHRMTDRLTTLEQRYDSGPICRQRADRPEAEAAIEAARPWLGEALETRNNLVEWLLLPSSTMPDYENMRAMAAALEAIPALVAAARAAAVQPSELRALRALRRTVVAAEEHQQRRRAKGQRSCHWTWIHTDLWSRVQGCLMVFDELDAGEDPQPDPETSAPPPSDATGEIVRLQEELRQANEAIERLLGLLEDEALQREAAVRRNAAALETLRATFELRPGCNLITDAADDACEYPRELMRALGYDGVDGPLPAQCLRDVRAQREQMERVRERLADMKGRGPDDEPLAITLAWVEERMAIMSELELFSADALNDTGEGLEHLGGEESAYIGQALYKIAALQSPPKDDDAPDDCTSGRELVSEPEGRGPEPSRH